MIDSIRADMISQVRADAEVTTRDQRRTIAISAVLTGLAAILGLTFSMFVSSGITRPVRRLLDGTRAVEAGKLDGSIDITTQDEIGQLTAAFNAMVARLRRNERMRKPSAGTSIPVWSKRLLTIRRWLQPTASDA